MDKLINEKERITKPLKIKQSCCILITVTYGKGQYNEISQRAVEVASLCDGAKEKKIQRGGPHSTDNQ